MAGTTLLWLFAFTLPLVARAASAEEADVTSLALAADDECSAGSGNCSLELLSLRAHKEKSDTQWGSCAQYGCTGYVRGHGCQCNDGCYKYRNCCGDYEAKCKAPPSPSPPASAPVPAVGDDGAVPGAGPLMTFYAYRVMGEWTYEPFNVNIANLPGVMWYLHHEVVVSCPRKFDITKMYRLKMQVRATPELVKYTGMNYGLRYPFDFGKATSSHGSDGTWDRYGFIVGCNTFGKPHQLAYPFDSNQHYADAIWYSLPGECPTMEIHEKTAHCNKTQPGGYCKGTPTGAWDCTWSYELAGNISVDELSDIDYDNGNWCKKGCKEYDVGSDKGRCTDFWDGHFNDAKNQARVQKALDLFKEKYPDLPADLPHSKCDFAYSDKYWSAPLQQRFGA